MARKLFVFYEVLRRLVGRTYLHRRVTETNTVNWPGPADCSDGLDSAGPVRQPFTFISTFT